MNPQKSYELYIKTQSLALESALIHQTESKLKAQINRCKAKIAELEATVTHNKPFGDDPSKLAACNATLTRLRQDRDSLRHHRKDDLRWYSRAAYLAYGFLRGKTYKQIEPKRYSDPNWAEIEKNILKFGVRAGTTQVLKQRFAEWKDAAGKPEVQK